MISAQLGHCNALVPDPISLQALELADTASEQQNNNSKTQPLSYERSNPPLTVAAKTRTT